MLSNKYTNSKKTKLVEIYKDTLEAIKNNKPTDKNYKYKIDNNILTNVYYINKYNINFERKDNEKINNVYVVNDECVNHSINYIKDGYNVTLLNMASAFKCGGGVENGASAQEEAIFRRTNLSTSLSTLKYPWKVNQLVCSVNVTIFKTDDYYYLDEPYNIDIISISAFRGETQTEEQRNILLDKIRVMCLIAKENHSEILILSALGCGAYRNDPKVNSKLFYNVLIDEGYASMFKKVIFAIIDDKNSNSNYNIFNDMFKSLN